MKWDRVTKEPQLGPFPAMTTREVDLADGYVIRERESTGGGAFGLHYIELRLGTEVLALANPHKRRWFVSLSAHTWPHRHVAYRKGLLKDQVFEVMREHAREGAEGRAS